MEKADGDKGDMSLSRRDTIEWGAHSPQIRAELSQTVIEGEDPRDKLLSTRVKTTNTK